MTANEAAKLTQDATDEFFRLNFQRTLDEVYRKIKDAARARESNTLFEVDPILQKPLYNTLVENGFEVELYGSERILILWHHAIKEPKNNSLFRIDTTGEHH